MRCAKWVSQGQASNEAALGAPGRQRTARRRAAAGYGTQTARANMHQAVSGSLIAVDDHGSGMFRHERTIPWCGTHKAYRHEVHHAFFGETVASGGGARKLRVAIAVA